MRQLFFVKTIAIALILSAVFSLFASYGFVFEFFVNFYLQYFLISVVLLLYFLFRKEVKFSVFMSLLLLFAAFKTFDISSADFLKLNASVFYISPVYADTRALKGVKSRTFASTFPRFRVVSLNVLQKNRQKQKTLEYLEQVQADVIVLFETDLKWHKALRSLSANYPHQILFPRDDCLGILVFSKHKIEQGKKFIRTKRNILSLLFTLSIAQEKIHFLATHTMPPVTREKHRLRNSTLAQDFAYFDSLSGPKVLLGDFNVTKWAPSFKKLVRNADLVDSAQYTYWQPTWPTFFLPAAITIDHVLVSRSLRVLRRQAGRHIGSDHFPVVVDLALNR